MLLFMVIKNKNKKQKKKKKQVCGGAILHLFFKPINR